jgi:dihydrofolate reductase
MRKILAAINMTLDGVCDHTKGIADDEVHRHYEELIRSGDAILYGRTTFELMKFWQTLVENPSGDKTMDDFAIAMDNIPKIVFSRTLNDTQWESATIATRGLKEEVLDLMQQPGGTILVGSRSLIIALMNLGLIDEFQLTVHPMIAGEGLSLFENINDQKTLKLLKTKTFGCGAVTLYYEPAGYSPAT